jgi:mono/diheme cytochrome c family protein
MRFRELIAGLLYVFLALIMLSGCGRNKEKKPLEGGAADGVEQTPVTDSPCMAAGEEVYSQYCLVCHQAGGGGVRGLNPPLKGTEYVLGEPARLISILLKGSNVGLEVNGTTYSNAMPGFAYLTDDEIACVATYIRNSFGNTATTVSPDEVRVARLP